jgi:hypothetical protein
MVEDQLTTLRVWAEVRRLRVEITMERKFVLQPSFSCRTTDSTERLGGSSLFVVVKIMYIEK